MLKCTLVTIATLLGTGILGLPSTLAYSGLVPFIVTFLMNYLFQIFIIVALTEVIYLYEMGENTGLSKDSVTMNNYGACGDEILDDENVSKKSSKEDLQKLMKISPTHQKIGDDELGADSTVNRHTA